MLVKILACVATASCIGGSASAATLAYTNVNDFMLNATTTGFEDFAGEDVGMFSGTTPVSFNGFSVANESTNQAVGVFTENMVDSAGGSALASGEQLAWGESNALGLAGTGDGPTFTFTFEVPVYGFGFMFSDADPLQTYQVSIAGETFVLGSGDTYDGFMGFISSSTFLTATFSQLTTGGFTRAFAIDNVKLSNIPPSAVPLPAGLVLLMSGLFGLGVMSRRRIANT